MLEVTGGASVTGKSKAAKVDFAEYYKVSRILDNGCMQASMKRGNCDTLLRVGFAEIGKMSDPCHHLVTWWAISAKVGSATG